MPACCSEVLEGEGRDRRRRGTRDEEIREMRGEERIGERGGEEEGEKVEGG